MSDNKRRGTLPSGAPPASSVPSYLTKAAQNSSANESAGSNESFISQVPQPFHITGDTDLPDDESYRVFRSKTTSPALASGRLNTHNRSDSSTTTTMLNPGVRSYVPGSSPLMPDAPSFEPRQRTQEVSMTTDNGGYRLNAPPVNYPVQQHGRSYGENNDMSSQQCGAGVYQPGNYPAAQYPRGGYGYGPHNNMSAGFPPSSTSPPWGNQYGYSNPIPGPYSHYGSLGSMNPHSNYPKLPPPMNQAGYGTYPAYVSPSAPTREREWQSRAHNNSGDGRGTAGYGVDQGSVRPGYVNLYMPPQQDMYSNTGRYLTRDSAQHHNGGMSFADRNREEVGQGNGNQYPVQGSGHGDKHNSFVVQSPQHGQHSSRLDNSQGNLRVNTRSQSQSRPESTVRETHTSRNENRGVVPRYSTPIGSSEVHENINTSSSAPIERPNQGGREFASEALRTPQLRSRRGQTIKAHSPVRNSLTTWLDNVPADTSAAIINTPRSPPKPLGYTLTAVAGGDPFSTPAPRNMFSNPATNPFGSHITPLTTVRPANDVSQTYDNASAQLRRLTNGGTRLPTVEEALDMANLPFVEYCRAESTGPDTFGVIKIRNIPYGVNRQEIMAFMGRNARLVAEFEHEPIHIVMERVTSKTLDCYVEFINLNEAISAVGRFETNKNGGRSGRLGQRHVDVELSSQEALMKDLFPKAKNTKWSNGAPHITPADPNDIYNSGFQGFVSKEELVMLVKHVEAPQRSPFSKDCPQRPFECLISTLLKYPWYMVDYITIEDRNLLHETTKSLMTLLQHHVMHNREDTRLTASLLKRAWRAVLACPGFTPTMKDDIVVICNIDTSYAMELGLAPFAAEWRFLWTIGPKKGAPVDLVLFYINLIRNITVQERQQLSLAEQSARSRWAVHDNNKLFGELDETITYPPGGLRRCTLAQVAAAEWIAIETALRRALTPALPAPAPPAPEQ